MDAPLVCETLPEPVAAARERLVAQARELASLRLSPGTSGNLSVRLPDGLLITPSARSFVTLQPEDLVCLDWQGGHRAGQVPSSEWLLHRDLYLARPDLHAWVHAHAPAATAVACLGHSIPPLHYMVLAAGTDTIQCAAYATFGTAGLSRAVVAVLGDPANGRACLMANHGLMAGGRTPAEALALAVEVEFLADLYLRTLAAGGPVLLDRTQLDAARERFRTYGTAASAGGAA